MATTPATRLAGSCIGGTPFGRRIGFQRMPASGDTYHLYLHHANTSHPVRLNTAECPQVDVDRAALRRAGALGHIRPASRSSTPMCGGAGRLAMAASPRVEQAGGGVASGSAMNADQAARRIVPMTKAKVPTRRMGSVMLVAVALLASSSPAATRTVQVNADGSFTPKFLLIHDGDTVEWELSSVTDSIIPIDTMGARDLCSAYKPFHPGGANEFTGPLPRAASGLFTLGPDGPGFVVKSGEAQCNPVAHPECKAAAVGAGRRPSACARTGEPDATMDTTWGDPDIAGVFIRLRWKDVHKGPGDFDWTAMDREIAKAVQHGKLYSLAFKAGHSGTPDWIFEPQLASPALSSHAEERSWSVQPRRSWRLSASGSKTTARAPATTRAKDGEPARCGTIVYLGSPADALYREFYFDLLRAAAQRIRGKNAWYRALAYIKPSGVNLFTHENRAPHRCDPGCRICNPSDGPPRATTRPLR